MSSATRAPVPEEQTEFAVALEEYIRAGYQMLYVPTSEEARVENEIRNTARKAELETITWDVFDGFQIPSSSDQPNSPNQKMVGKGNDPVDALKKLASDAFTGNIVFVFRDLDDFWGDPTLRRAVRSLTEFNRLVNKKLTRPVIITSPRLEIHPKLKSCITTLEFQLPDERRLRRVMELVKRSVQLKDDQSIECSDELTEQIVWTLRGLTSNEAENTLSLCLARHAGFVPEMLRTIKHEKANIIHKSEILTFVDEDLLPRRDQIGGYDELLSFVDRRKLAYSKEARGMSIDMPKGIVLLGVPGTGKSYVATAIATVLGLPLVTLDVGAIFGSLVGESEQRMRDMKRQVEAFHGCVLLIDEADKAFGGAVDSTGDSGVTRRVFGQMLSWLANKQDRTFVIMTMNRITGIPPEMLRTGRFDAVFFTDLPTEYEREQILRIHLKKRTVNPDQLPVDSSNTTLMGPAEWATLVERTKSFVGSEIEEVVKEARFLALENRQAGTPTFGELTEAASSITPVTTLDQAGVQAIRDFCKNRARPVSRDQVGSGSGGRRRRPAAGEREGRKIDLTRPAGESSN